VTLGNYRWNMVAGTIFVFLSIFLLSNHGLSLTSGPASAQAQETPAGLESNPTGGAVPGSSRGTDSSSIIWGEIRHGSEGTVASRDPRAGRLIQSEGETWRLFRNGPLMKYSAWALLGIVGLLALFYLIRGRIRIESGKSGNTITRFKLIERVGHWTLAVSFILLALTGLNILYGRYVLLPVLGPDAFGAISNWGKISHNYVGFAFMIGLAMIFVMWVLHNFPSRTDIGWLMRGGGMFVKHSHPPAKKFNAGQKLIFWAVILIGVSLSLTGISLMFPFEMSLFAQTFAFMNIFGFDLPTDLSAIQEMQLSQSWHAIQAIVLIVVVIAHIYIGSIGMEGAFDAMGTGEVDVNWAREHHSIWAEELENTDQEGASSGKSAGVPAE